MADQVTTNVPAIVTKKRKRKPASESGPRKPKQKPVECPICLHARLPKLMLRVSTCNCEYCVLCVREAFSVGLQASNGITNFPARCCGRVLDFMELEEYLTPQLRKAYKSKAEEMSSDRPLYCASSTCGRFIPEDNIKEDFGVCGKCKKKTCTKQHCNRLQSEHSGIHTICPGFFEEQELNTLAEEKMWKRCPKCCAWTERIRGCNDIRCICRTEWCYKCGNPHRGKMPCICYARPLPQLDSEDDMYVQKEVVIIHDEDDQTQQIHGFEDIDVKPSIEDLDMESPSMLYTEADLTAEMDRFQNLRTSELRQDPSFRDSPRTQVEQDIMEQLDALAAPTSNNRSLEPNMCERYHESPSEALTPLLQSTRAESPTETFEDLFRTFTANKTLSPVPMSSVTVETTANSKGISATQPVQPEIHSLCNSDAEFNRDTEPHIPTSNIEPPHKDPQFCHNQRMNPFTEDNPKVAVDKPAPAGIHSEDLSNMSPSI